MTDPVGYRAARGCGAVVGAVLAKANATQTSRLRANRLWIAASLYVMAPLAAAGPCLDRGSG
ncbi:hypothetical protein [Streptomyces sp. NPDC088733]|uniref:hypothetical protein n=1 Tax=Streptomyces sp. NPDC088733 TaxID=3365880 RepID=UPI0037FB8C29